MTEIRPASRVRPFLPEPGMSSPLVGVVWMLLLINTLGFNELPTVVPIPRVLAQLVTMGALVAALGLAVVLNPRLRFRPSPYLLLLSILVLLSFASSLRLESGLGAVFRCIRFALFVTTLWLLSRWWRGDLSFVRHHVRTVSAVLLTVLVGLAVSPGTARPDEYQGRLIGTLWPIPAPQVGQYAAVVAGLTILLWLTRNLDGRSTALIAPLSIGVLLLSHTRTATIALGTALVGAILTLTLTSSRSRRALGVTAMAAGLIAVAFGPALQRWIARDQDPELLGSLTGRQKVWDALLAVERTRSEQTIGQGLTDKSFNGLSIDSTWLAVYHDQGLIGVAIVVTIIVGLLAAAALRPPSPARACAVFLILYCAIATYTEVGLGDASPYLLHLAVAASLLTPGAQTTARPVASARGSG